MSALNKTRNASERGEAGNQLIFSASRRPRKQQPIIAEILSAAIKRINWRIAGVWRKFFTADRVTEHHR